MKAALARISNQNAARYGKLKAELLSEMYSLLGVNKDIPAKKKDPSPWPRYAPHTCMMDSPSDPPASVAVVDGDLPSGSHESRQPVAYNKMVHTNLQNKGCTAIGRDVGCQSYAQHPPPPVPTDGAIGDVATKVIGPLFSEPVPSSIGTPVVSATKVIVSDLPDHTNCPSPSVDYEKVYSRFSTLLLLFLIGINYLPSMC